MIQNHFILPIVTIVIVVVTHHFHFLQVTFAHLLLQVDNLIISPSGDFQM